MSALPRVEPRSSARVGASDRSPRGELVAATSAVLVSAAACALYARGGFPWVVLGWVGLVPWLAALDRAPTVRRALLLGVAMAIAFELAVFGWFAPAIADYSGAPTVLLLALQALASPLLQPQFTVAALARAVVRRSPRATPAALVVVTASAYVAAEALTPKLFGDSLGYPLSRSPWLRQGADVAGVAGLTFVIVVVNACVAAALDAAWTRERPASRRTVVRPLAVGAGLVVLLAAYGAERVRALTPDPDVRPVKIGLVQADLGHYDRMAEQIGRFETVRRILDTHVAMSAEALASPDLALLLWPETVYPTTFGRPKSESGAAFDREIVDFVRHAGVPLVFGSYDTDGASEFNAAFFLAPDATEPRPFAVYRKTRLFPLTERVPAFLDSPRLRRALPWLGTWVPGQGANVVPVRLPDGSVIRIAPLICYDVLDPALARASTAAGADVIVTLSNDSWFAFGPGPALHLQGAVFRSIETRRPQVRATNTGISAVIDATGEVRASAGVDARATLVAPVVPERRVMTPVVRFGEWIDPCAMIAAIAIVVRSRRRPA